MKAIRPSSLSNILKNSYKSASFKSQQSCIVSGLLLRNFSSCRKVFEEFDQTTTLGATGVSSKTSIVYEKLGKESFGEEIANILMAPLQDQDIEVKPDGILYLPEIKYRRILNRAFGPGGWCLVPLSDFKIEKGSIIQEYGLFCRGQFVSQAFGEQTVDEQGYKSIGSSLEGAKSNALMRCCKDIGIASDLWDPNFIISWKAENVVEAFCEHVTKKTTKKLYRRKDREFSYPYVEKGRSSTGTSTKQAATEVELPAEEVNEEPAVVMTPDSTNFDNEASLFDSFGMDDGSAQYKKESPAGASTSARKKNATSSNHRGGYQFDINGTFPFGKFKGQKIGDIIDTIDFKRYVKFMEENNIQPQFLAQVKSYMDENKIV